MRYFMGFIFVLALGVMGCSETTGTGGSGGDGGSAGMGGGGVGGAAACVDNVCPCTEAGIRAAVAESGGPFTFDCDGTEPVVTAETIVIDNDVILDGEGNLTVQSGGDYPHRVFSVPEGVKAELHRLTATRGSGGVANEGTLTIQDCVISGNWTECCDAGGGIRNGGMMMIINSTVSGNIADHGSGGGISNGGEMTIINSTVSDNVGDPDGWGPVGGGISNGGEMTIINSTVSDNSALGAVGDLSGGGIWNGGTLTLTHSTAWGNTADSGDAIAVGRSSYTEIANTLIDGDCGAYPPGTPDITSNGYNIESPGDTCGFDDPTDQVNVTAEQLNLGPLQDNGGGTQTHALGAGSVAIDHIPAVDCGVDEDQRGEPRPGDSMCDVGAFEVQP
jgi:hypothetical protein